MSANKKETAEILTIRWPKTFSWSNPKPLKIGIREEVLDSTHSEDEKKILLSALNAYFRRIKYVTSPLNNTHRYDLNGNESELITDKEKEHAVQSLINFNKKKKEKSKNKRKHEEAEKKKAELKKKETVKVDVKVKEKTVENRLTLKKASPSKLKSPVIKVKKKRVIPAISK